MSLQQPGVQRPDDGADSFPDPKRSWGRSGSLVGTWVVLLLGIYFAGWMFDGLLDKSAESNLDNPVESSKQTAQRILHFSFVERDPSRAEALLCDNFTGRAPQRLTDKLDSWEEENVRANASPTFDDDNGVSSGSGTLYHTRVDIETGGYIEKWYYDITVQPSDDIFCVSKIKDVTPSN